MPELDFSGLRDAVQASFTGEFPEVLRRARKRRRAQVAGTAVAAALVAAVMGGGIALGGIGGDGTPGRDAAGVIPGVTGGPTPPFLRSPSPSRSPGAPAYRYSTGKVVAGDVNHLYARYDDCRTGKCLPGVIGTQDRGRTWRAWPMPVEPDSLVGLDAIGPRTLLVHYQSGRLFDQVRQGWLASTDGGANWREVSPRVVSAVPAGWRPVAYPSIGYRGDPLYVADPATGDIGHLRENIELKMANLVTGAPAGAGIWVTGFTAEHVDHDHFVPTGSAVQVSRDGGRTWQRSTFPANLSAGEDTGPAVATTDGQTVYAVGQAGGKLVIYRSQDGGRHWARAGTHDVAVGTRPIRAAVRPDGALLIQAGLHASESVLMLVSTDGGKGVRPIEPAPGAAALPVGGGYIQDEWPDAAGCWVSPDGLAWDHMMPPKLF